MAKPTEDSGAAHIKFGCSHCGKRLKAPPRMAGKAVSCRNATNRSEYPGPKRPVTCGA